MFHWSFLFSVLHRYMALPFLGVSLALACDLRMRSWQAPDSRHRVQATTSARALEKDRKPFPAMP